MVLLLEFIKNGLYHLKLPKDSIHETLQESLEIILCKVGIILFDESFKKFEIICQRYRLVRLYQLLDEVIKVELHTLLEDSFGQEYVKGVNGLQLDHFVAPARETLEEPAHHLVYEVFALALVIQGRQQMVEIESNK
jgi:hypothetical protein